MFLPLIPVFIQLIMSKRRETSTVVITFSLIGLSFTIYVAGINYYNCEPSSTLFFGFMGSLVAWIGLFYRENIVERDFEESDKFERPIRKSQVGFHNSLLYRILQITPFIF